MGDTAVWCVWWIWQKVAADLSKTYASSCSKKFEFDTSRASLKICSKVDFPYKQNIFGWATAALCGPPNLYGKNIAILDALCVTVALTNCIAILDALCVTVALTNCIAILDALCVTVALTNCIAILLPYLMLSVWP